jgi:hypothetical protein
MDENEKLAAALHEASVYGIGATSDFNQKVILQAAQTAERLTRELAQTQAMLRRTDTEIQRLDGLLQAVARERDEALDACWSAIPWLEELEHLGGLVDHKRRKQTLDRLRKAVHSHEQQGSGK